MINFKNHNENVISKTKMPNTLKTGKRAHYQRVMIKWFCGKKRDKNDHYYELLSNKDADEKIVEKSVETARNRKIERGMGNSDIR